MTEGLEYEHVNKFLMEVETMVILLVLLVLFCTICICVSNHENIGRTWTFKKHSKDVFASYLAYLQPQCGIRAQN